MFLHCKNMGDSIPHLAGTDHAYYKVDYAGHDLLIGACGADLPETAVSEADLVLECESDWPRDKPVFVFRDGSVN